MNDIVPYLGLFEDTAKYYKANRKEPIVILEIGVDSGWSTKAFLRGLEKRENREKEWGGGILYSIDIIDCRKNIRVDGNNWVFIQGDSRKVEWTRMVDILFIDGDHSYESAKADYEKYTPFVKHGGIIFMHDVIHPKLGINQFWKEINLPKVALNHTPVELGIIHVD